MTPTVLSLRVGDLVSDDHGTLGKVVGFRVDGVVVEWEHETRCESDKDLQARGVVRVAGQ